MSLEDRLEPRFKTKTCTFIEHQGMHWVCCVEPERIYPLLSATHRFPSNCPGPGKGSCLVSLPVCFFTFFFWPYHVFWGSQFPDQGLDPSHRSESPESYPLGYQELPVPCVSCGIYSWLLGSVLASLLGRVRNRGLWKGQGVLCVSVSAS